MDICIISDMLVETEKGSIAAMLVIIKNDNLSAFISNGNKPATRFLGGVSAFGGSERVLRHTILLVLTFPKPQQNKNDLQICRIKPSCRHVLPERWLAADSSGDQSGGYLWR